ncbi:hypothetical protein [Streptomyces hoynatensis]|uniref:Uncharacterized protein n=1 Tax=Streptomyces hoynatensis TaxID=1141874 RepID=A0A3A9YWW8_9ACTN|nr:hypothetical protein [Streptomyces hoynatensis]RKN40124.1 hypothetical protein D7294_19680 [Streptomyces hoynatensis]
MSGEAAGLVWGPRRLPVPYVARWSGESVVTQEALRVRPDGRGLAYRDESAGDRDRRGVLWARLLEEPGSGQPDFRTMHPARQRRAMLERLCQVCGGQADRTGRGWLFVLRRPTPAGDRPDWPEGLLSTKPPVCGPCAHLAAEHCPHLGEPAFVRVRKPRVWGVFGGLFVPGPGGRLAAGGDADLPYGHPAAPWFLANQVVVELARCTRLPGP